MLQRGVRTSRGQKRGLLVAISADFSWPQVRTFSWPRTAGATTPPVISSPTVNPQPAVAGSSVTFTWQVTSAAGETETQLDVTGPGGTGSFGGCFEGTLISGTSFSGTYQLTCTVPPAATNGTWTSQIEAQDTVGQSVFDAGPSFTVTGGSDATPPVISSPTVNPQPAVAGSSVTFTWQVTSAAGETETQLDVTGPGGTGSFGGCFEGTLISGTSFSGTYQLTCTVPPAATNGTWTSQIEAQDTVGQSVFDAGPSFTVTGGSDATPPVISSPTVNPQPAVAGSSVTFTWQVTSAAGETETQLDVTGPGGTGSFGGCFEGTLISGTSFSGTYQLTCTVPPAATNGTWTSQIEAQDTVGQSVFDAGPSFTVTAGSMAPQIVTFGTTPPSPAHVGSTYTPTATSTSGLTVVITLDGASTGCTLTGGLVTLTAPGTCVVDANQAGNSTYSPAAQVQQSLTVTKAPQVVTFGTTPPTPATVGSTYTPTATSTSGLTAVITLDRASTGCTLTGGVVTLTAPGTCVVDANQAGNSTYSPASQVSQSFTVTSAITPPSATHGYWLVGSDGGIFTFGSAQFYGSTGTLRLQRPVVGIVPTADRGGYWLDASDGGVFSYGDTQFYGSVPGLGLHPAGSGLPNSLDAPIVGMVPSINDGGYFMVASDGGVFAFGDAHFAGSCPGIGGCSGAAVAVMPDAQARVTGS